MLDQLEKEETETFATLLFYSLTLHDEEMWIIYIELDRVE
jgi:hypothetical protein